MSEKVLTGKTAVKRVLPVVISILVIILVSIILASVKSSAPSPTISDKDSSYLTVGSHKISKDILYRYMRKNYGVSELARLVDEKLLADYVTNVTDDELKAYAIEALYGVEFDKDHDYSTGIKGYFEDPKEVWEDFLDTLVLNGTITKAQKTSSNADLFNIVKEYYRLDCAREKFAKDYYWNTLNKIANSSANKQVFTNDKIESYYDENYAGKSTGIFIPFDSQEQALRVMKMFGINTDSELLDDEKGWISSSYDPTLSESATNVKKFLTPEEVLIKFVEMYNYMMSHYNGGNDILGGDFYTTKLSANAATNDVYNELSIATTVKCDSFKLPGIAKTYNASSERGEDVEITWTVKNFDSEDKDVHATISTEKDADGNYTVTVNRPDSGTKRIYLNAKIKYGDSETSKRFTVTINNKSEAEVDINNTVKDVTLKYVIDSVEKLTEFDAEKAGIVNYGNVAFSWTAAELSAIDSKLSDNLKYDSTKLTLSDDYTKFYKSYTLEPFKGTNYYFLAIKLAEKADTELVFDTDEEYAELTDEQKADVKALIDEIVEKMKDAAITDNDITRILFENRTKNGLTIYDNYLDAVYGYTYNNFFDSTLSVTDYLPYVSTTKSHKSVVATIGYGKNKVEFTADQLFAALEPKYGVMASIDFIDDYLLLSDENYNDVFNPYTGKIMDKEEYKKALQNEVATVKKNFEYGYFTNSSLSQYGFIPAFGADYGWKNFVKDYFVSEGDAGLLVSRGFGGSIYTGAQEIFTKELYKDVEKVMQQIEKSKAEYYSVNVMNLVISVDFDLNATPDTNNVTGSENEKFADKSNWTPELKALAKELAEKFVELAPQTGKVTLTEQMSALVTEYNKAVPTKATTEPLPTDTIYTYNYFGKYKAAGLKLKWEDSATYTNTSSIVKEFSDKLKEIYDEIEKQGLVGETIDAPYFSDVAFETSYGLHMIAVVGTTKPTEIPANAKDIIAKHLYMTLTEDEKEDDHDALVTLTTEEKAFIDTWYTPAKNVLGGTNPIALALITLRENNIDLIKYENNDNLERYKSITEILEKTYSEEDK